MFKLMGKEINAILSAQTILIWTYEIGLNYTILSACEDTETIQNSRFYFRTALTLVMLNNFMYYTPPQFISC